MSSGSSRGRHVTSFCLSLVAIVPLLARGDDPPYPLVDARECRARDGLPNFLAKARTPGSTVKVAYLGGSITEQAGWRPKTLAYLGQAYPVAKFSEINAAIGGTGSDLGVYRLDQDVLGGKPDLLFVEFATNDGGAPPIQIQKCMEGIVRQTWKALPDCDICFVYTLVESAAPPMFQGKFPRSATAMEQVADHYGIPTIQMAMEVARLAKEGKLLWSAPLAKTDEERAARGDKMAFASDGVHPYPETGHELYLQAVVRSFKPIADASKAPAAHKLGTPMIADHYEDAKLISIREADLSKGFERLDPKVDGVARDFANRLPSVYRGSQPGDSITFRFRGKSAAIYDLIGPDSCRVIVTVDDRPPVVVSRFDPFCLYHRPAVLPIAADLPDAVHTVRVEIDPVEPDRMKILGDNARNVDRLERFKGTNFYPGAILLRGELIR